MANHTKTITLTDLQQNILDNDLYNDPSDNSGLDAWIDGAMTGKLNNCWKRFQQEWTTKLMNDDSFTDAIPSNQADFVALVIARDDYKPRKERDDANAIQEHKMTRAKDISKILTDANISGNIDVDGVTNLDVVDIDGAVDMASTLGVILPVKPVSANVLVLF